MDALMATRHISQKLAPAAASQAATTADEGFDASTIHPIVGPLGT